MPQNLIDAMHNTLKMYWRMRVAVAIVREIDGDEFKGLPINLINLPNLNSSTTVVGYESSTASFDELFRHISDGHLSKDIFLRTIDHLETFYSAKLTAKSLSPDGTLGVLQKRCQLAYNVSDTLISEIDEIRERRNSIIHHHGLPTAKHNAAAELVFHRSAGVIGDPSTISLLTISDEYLAHCVDKISIYSALFV